MTTKSKEKRINLIFDLSKIKTRPDDGRVYCTIERKTISSTSYAGLIDKLYDKFFGIEATTIDDFFPVWMKWRAEHSSVTAKTIKENGFLYNALLKDQTITYIPMRQLTVQDFIVFFRELTKNRTMTRKRFNDMKSLLNGMLFLAVEQGIIERNILNDINYRQFTYKAENHNVFPYTEDERLRIIKHLDNSLYSLAIKLDFYLIIRIGELKALKFSDIHGDFIRIERFVNDKNEIIEDVKGHQEDGKRYLPLVPAAKELIKQIRLANPASEYLFIQGGQPLATVTFNRHLKKCCDELGIAYRSSHKIRFSTASLMYKNGVNETAISDLLGHTTLNMTRHYLRNITPEDETAQKMKEILV